MVGIFHSITEYDIAHWPVPHYVDPPTARTWLPGYAIAFEVVTTAFVLGRLYLRGQQKGPGIVRSYGADDIAIFVGWIFSLALTILGCVSVWVYGVGRHVWDVEPQNYSKALFAGWLAQMFFVFSTGGTKMSVFLFYFRLMKGTKVKKWLYANWTLMALTAGIWISGFASLCFMCFPLHAFWDYIAMQARGDNNFHCVNGDALTIYVGVLTLASDFWTAALPCAFMQVHDLGLTPKQKVALNAVFCLGFIVTGIGAVRTYYLWEIGQHSDLSWIGFDLFVTSIAECQISIICTCAPFCRAFFRKYLPASTQAPRDRLSMAGKSISTAGKRVSARLSGRVRASIGTFTTSEEGLRSPELHGGDELGDGAEMQSYVLAKDETTGRIFLQSRAVDDGSLDDIIGPSGSGTSRSTTSK